MALPAPGITLGADRRIVDATLACIARVGVTKTTVDDVAAEAGISRATLYRLVRGKRQLVTGAVDAEVRRLLTAVDAAFAEAADLEDALVAAIVLTAREIEDHPALRFVLDHEPELVCRHLAFSAGTALLLRTTEHVAPRLERFLPPYRAARAAEWVCRIVLSYAASPSLELSLTDPDHVRRLVHDFVLPATGFDQTLRGDLS